MSTQEDKIVANTIEDLLSIEVTDEMRERPRKSFEHVENTIKVNKMVGELALQIKKDRLDSDFERIFS